MKTSQLKALLIAFLLCLSQGAVASKTTVAQTSANTMRKEWGKAASVCPLLGKKTLLTSNGPLLMPDSLLTKKSAKVHRRTASSTRHKAQ